MNFRKIASVLLCGTLAAAMLSGCDEVDKDTYVARTRSEAEAESKAEAEAQNSQNAEELGLTPSDWSQMKFTIDGTELTLDKLPYSSIANLGWSYDTALYGFQNFMFKPGSIYDRSVSLVHEGYDDDVMLVGFTNFGEAECGADANHVWSVEFTSFGKSSYPAVSIGDVTWGSDEASVKAVFGEPTSSEKGNDGSTQLTYSDGSMNLIRFYVYGTDGVGKIVMESFD